MLETVRNGRPTAPERQKIINRVKTMREGEVLKHEEIEALTGLSRAANPSRYRSVFTAARGQILRELGIYLVSVRGEGYQYPKGFDQVGSGVTGMRAGLKKVGRSHRIIEAVGNDRLPDPKHQQARDHILMQARYLIAQGKAHRKAMELTVGTPEVAPSMALPKT